MSYRSWTLPRVPADLSPVHEPVPIREIADRLDFSYGTVRNWADNQRGVGRYAFPDPMWKDGATLLYDWPAVWCWGVASGRIAREMAA